MRGDLLVHFGLHVERILKDHHARGGQSTVVTVYKKHIRPMLTVIQGKAISSCYTMDDSGVSNKANTVKPLHQ